MPVPISQTFSLTSSLVPKEESSNMPFIDDELLWCPDNDGKMVDLTQCLQENNAAQSVEFSAMELSAFVGAPTASSVPSEDGEGVSSVSEEPFDTLDTFLRELQADLAEASQPTSTTTPLSTITPCRRQRYNIAAANPLLAEKLAAPSIQLSPVSSTSYAARAEIKSEEIITEGSK
ncbi:GSCOCG00000764001-RA-CDS, partial [Cotesia congregata]